MSQPHPFSYVEEGAAPPAALSARRTRLTPTVPLSTLLSGIQTESSDPTTSATPTKPTTTVDHQERKDKAIPIHRRQKTNTHASIGDDAVVDDDAARLIRPVDRPVMSPTSLLLSSSPSPSAARGPSRSPPPTRTLTSPATSGKAKLQPIRPAGATNTTTPATNLQTTPNTHEKQPDLDVQRPISMKSRLQPLKPITHTATPHDASASASAVVVGTGVVSPSPSPSDPAAPNSGRKVLSPRLPLHAKSKPAPTISDDAHSSTSHTLPSHSPLLIDAPSIGTSETIVSPSGVLPSPPLILNDSEGPSTSIAPSTIRMYVRNYYAANESQQPVSSSSSPPSSSGVLSDVALDVEPASQLAAVLAEYERLSHPRRLHDPFVFVSTDNSVGATPSTAAAAVGVRSNRKHSIQTLVEQSSGQRRVHISKKDFCMTLIELGFKNGSILTIRNQPYPLRIVLDNTALQQCGVPEVELDHHSLQVWVDEEMTIEQLKDEMVRQFRENKHVLGSDRHRIFYQLPTNTNNNNSMVSLASTSSSSSSPACSLCEVTQHLARRIGTLPLRAYRLGLPVHETTLFVRKDPTRWLHQAIKDGQCERAESLIQLGGDAHLLDSHGHSGFFYAAPSPRLRSLLQRYFPPSPLEVEAVERLMYQYSSWLHDGACVKVYLKHMFILNHHHRGPSSSSEEVRHAEEERYVFVTKRQPPRMITNEIHKTIGEIGIIKQQQYNNKHSTIVPTNMVQQDQIALTSRSMYDTAAGGVAAPGSASLPLPTSFVSDGFLPASELPPLYPKFDRTPALLLFDVALDLSDQAEPKTIVLRSPPYRSTTKEVPEIASLESVSKFRSILTRFDVWKNRYMMNLKMMMLLFSAVGAAYNFSFVFSTRSQWGEQELIVQFVATLFKALIACIFFIRIYLQYGWKITKSFVKIKSTLLLKQNKSMLRESYLYFFCLECADSITILTNVRILSSLEASNISLSWSNFRPSEPEPLSEGQSMQLSLYLSLASLVILNLFDTTISFLADETPSYLKKLQRYFGLHLMVLTQCFTSLRLSYDLREIQLSMERSSHDGILSYITPTSMNFIFAYLFGLSIKSLNLTFHPNQNHKLMDEILNAKAIEADCRMSIVYVALTMVVYGSIDNPTSIDREILDTKSDNILYQLALGFFFASGLVLSLTGLLPFTLRWLNQPIEWIPEILRGAPSSSSSSSTSPPPPDSTNPPILAAPPTATLVVEGQAITVASKENQIGNSATHVVHTTNHTRNVIGEQIQAFINYVKR